MNKKPTIIYATAEEESHTLIHLESLSNTLLKLLHKLVVLSIVVFGLAWIWRLGGLTYEEWPILKVFCTVPILILLVRVAIPIIKKTRKWAEIN